MILYHGTNADINKIELEKCMPYKDFGKGFYTTTLFNQAKAMAIKKSKIYGGKPCVIEYEVPDNLLSLRSLRRKIFKKATKNWALFIINNRNRDFTDVENAMCNSDGKYEIVSGPVANDTLTTLIQRYSRGYIDENALLREMKYSAPSDQISFHSEKAVSFLKKVNTIWII